MLALVSLLMIAAPVRVLVLDLDAVGVEPHVARSVDALVIQGASVDGVEVVAQADIKKLAEVDAAKQELDCSASSCLAELAGALGAQLVVFGTVSRLGETTTVSLSLFDQRSGQITRETLATEDVGALPREIPPRVRSLLSPFVAGLAPTPEAGPSPLFLAGAGGVALGAAALVTGGVVAAIMETAIQDPAGASEDKRSAQVLGRIGVAVAAVGGVALGLGGAALALGMDE